MMPIRISLLNYDGPWLDDLSQVPSECWRGFTWSSESHHLYLHWRFSDPWQGYVIRRAGVLTGEQLDAAAAEVPMFCPQDDWSSDLFEQASRFFAEDDLEKAKIELEVLAHKFLMAPTWEKV